MGSDDPIDARLLIVALEEAGGATAADLAARAGVAVDEARGVLDGLAGAGLVHALDAGRYSVPPLDGAELRELYLAEILLEGLAIRSAPAFGAAALDVLRAANARLRAAAGDALAAIAADDDFHAAIVTPSRNERLIALHRSTKASLVRYERRYVVDVARIERSAAQHDEIVAALERDDRELACALVRLNYETSGRDIEAELAGEL